jgi:hypothetical protein
MTTETTFESLACEEFVRMQHELCTLLGVDADTDSIALHARIRLGITRLLRENQVLDGRLRAVQPGENP